MSNSPSSRNLLLGFIVLLLISGGAWYAVTSSNKGSGQAGQPAMTPQPAVSPTPPPTGEKDTLLRQLAPDVLAVVRIFPRGVGIGADAIWSLRDTLLGTKVAKRFKLEEELTEKFKEGFNQKVGETPDASELTYETFIDSIQKSNEYWHSLREVTLVISGKTQPLKNKDRTVPVPPVLLRASFLSVDQAKASFDLLTKKLLGDPASAVPKGIKVKQTSPDKLDIDFSDESQGALLHSTLSWSGPELTFVTGEQWENAFLTTSPETALVTTVGWQTVQQLNTDTVAGTFYFRPDDLSGYIERLVKDLPPKAQQEMHGTSELEQTLSLYRDMTAVGASLDFSNGATMHSCALARPGSGFAAAYDKLLQNLANGNQAEHFSTLLDAQTIAAMRIDTTSLAMGLNAVLEKLKNIGLAGKPLPDGADIARIGTTMEETANRLQFQEVGIFVAPPIMPPIIGAGLYLGGSKLSGEELISAVVDAINNLAALGSSGTTPSPSAPKLARKSKSADGKPELELVLGGLKLVGALVDEHSVAISIDSSIISDLATRGRAGKSLFARFSSRPSLVEDLAKSSYYFYLNTDQLIGLVRTFSPALLAAQKPGQRIESDELEELLNLGRIAYLSYQRNYAGAVGSVCTESRSFLLRQ
ncbi:MAG: hypothetical protein U0136_04505 [Bdellovibrionota bacterium]